MAKGHGGDNMPTSQSDERKAIASTHTRFVIGYLQHRASAEALEEVLTRAGETRSVDELTDATAWSSYSEFRRLLEATATVLGGPEVLDEIGRYSFDAVTSPELLERVLAVGSPGRWLGDFAGVVSATAPIVEMGAEELGPTEWMIRLGLREPYEMFPELCRYLFGLIAVVPKIFGYQALPTHDEACQCHGARFCLRRLRWSEADEPSDPLGHAQFRAQLFEARLEGLQETLGELVSGEGIDSVLPRIVAAASRAVMAPAYVLAIDDPSTSKRHMYCDGINVEHAERYADPEDDSFPAGPNVLAVTVASGRCRYGHLVAIRPSDGCFDVHEAASLEAYARMAAVALDSASAIDTALRQASTATALLDLSNALIQQSSIQDLAEQLVHAVPFVVDCDRAVVTLIDQDGITARNVAFFGYDPELEARLRELVISVPALSERKSDLVFRQPSVSDGYDPAGRLRVESVSVLSANLPIKVGHDLLGWISVDVTERPERLRDSPDLQWRLQGLASQAAIGIANARLVEEIRHQALHDHLTGLPNRVLVVDRAEQMLARAHRHKTNIALLFIDLDGFKDVNDTFGHEVGDELLKAVGARFSTVVRETDTIGRLGGDEFVVLAEGVGLAGGPEDVADRLIASLALPFHIDGHETAPITISASIGIAAGARESAQDLLRDADVALYAAKAAGKRCSVLFEPEMQVAIRRHHELETDLRLALVRDQYFLVYQPVFDLRHMKVLGVEALLRWRHPLRGIVGPDEFIPVLEETGMILEVGAWVLDEACRQSREWLDRGRCINVSVNVSGRQLEGNSLVEQVTAALQHHSIKPDLLTIEITETVLMRDTDDALKQLNALKNIGVRIAIDDFGTGHSSLAYLRQFPVDSIKIDRSFITGMSDTSEGKALIQTLVQLGKALNIETVAEGVEESFQLRLLQEEQCDSGQGFLFARPIAPEEVEQLFEVASRI
jgi:diguanylate cyclase (GGDEF)-like protein